MASGTIDRRQSYKENKRGKPWLPSSEKNPCRWVSAPLYLISLFLTIGSTMLIGGAGIYQTQEDRANKNNENFFHIVIY